jgi:AraC family transcriptional regulator, transcriptional activator of pobA
MSGDVINSLRDLNIADLKLKGFKASAFTAKASGAPIYSRRDYYKIAFSTSKSVIHYADKSMQIDGTYIFFGNPHLPYSAELLSHTIKGYHCFFTEDFLKPSDRSKQLNQSPLFKIGGTPILNVPKRKKGLFTNLFQSMIDEQEGDYSFKDDVIRNYITLILHESLKLQPIENSISYSNAFTRITSFFLELLERQFPIESQDQPLKLKTAQDFAERLSVHVNYLNRSIKEVTGKTTSYHISQRIIIEAKALLKHTDWSIGDIGVALGFEYPTYFNNYFKRITGTIPKTFRIHEI